MKREIKFRAKVKYNGNHLFSGDWVIGSLIIKSKGVFIYIIEEDELGNIIREFEVEVDPETVGQYTGLKDCKGVDIYEGDLVQHEAWNYPFKIIFDKDKARFVCEMKSGLTQYIDYERMIVIGNIHQNK